MSWKLLMGVETLKHFIVFVSTFSIRIEQALRQAKTETLFFRFLTLRQN